MYNKIMCETLADYNDYNERLMAEASDKRDIGTNR